MAVKLIDVVTAGVAAKKTISAVCIDALIKRHKMTKAGALQVLQTVNSARAMVAKLRRAAKQGRKGNATRTPKKAG